VILGGLSFADQKLDEIAILTKALTDGAESVTAELEDARAAVTALNESSHRNNLEVQEAIANLENVRVDRELPFAERIKLQHAWLNLPLFPTTTIGSFPQSPEVRKTRADWLKGNITDAEYNAFIEKETARWIKIQEELDIDVLVHGEFERTDMVEYFGQKLAGFQATKFGWVQSYGSRAVRPPLIYGDVAFTEEITVKESVYAQSLTKRPVKGMLTAPVTIINWSFVRDDVPESVVANQVGLAL
ncbi:5-methyltetrahydropteroyltriglutamate--homocysteine S-methyltransferase, partial [Listeria monocytogenes]|nr:5-methyltetrahydropteroyltriglutamate--homocysteine S-methyltransferase [Listeria monocytogenes]